MAESSPETPSAGKGVIRFVKVASLLLLLLFAALLAFALIIALTAAEAWAPVVQIARDVVVMILVLETALIVLALAILLLQAASFIIMLKTEIKPILDHTRETTRLTRATAEFVSRNSLDPLIQIKSFLSGLLGFLREMIRIRSLLQSTAAGEDEANEPKDGA